ncbi:MAG: hypothetical protein ABL973_06235 [Micropepsaceae bacterium]
MTEPNTSRPVQRFFGLVLIVMSALWIAFCGLCGFWMIAMMFESGEFTAESIGTLLLVLGLSGGGAAAGYALLVVGRGLAK